MDLGLTGKRVLVTGGSKGIGLACGHAFAAEGAEVTLCARSEATLAAAAEDIGQRHGARVQTIVADLARAEDRSLLFARCPDVDILVNNAGAIPGGDLFAVSMETWQDAWQLKVFGFIHLTQLYLAPMRARGDGAILNVIGMASRMPRWKYICGAAGNAALVAFTEAVGAESAHWGVRVFGINPGPTRTDRILKLMRDQSADPAAPKPALPFGRIGEPDEVGALAAMLASSRVTYLSGTVVDMDGGARNRGA